MTRLMINLGQRWLFSGRIRTVQRKRVNCGNRTPTYFTLLALCFLVSGNLWGAGNGEENYLLSVKQITHSGRPAFVIQTTKAFTFHSFLLKEPDRLVIDLDGVVPAPDNSREVGDSNIVKAIRVGRHSKEKTRVVFDLSALIGYKLVNDPKEPGKLLLAFNSILKEVGVSSNTAEPRIFIDTTHPVQYKTTLAFNPHRVIVDLWDVTLIGEALAIPGSSGWIDQIRVSQFDPQTIRVVLDVQEPRGCVVTPSRTVDNRLEIKTIQKITAVQWKQEKKNRELLIRSTGEIDEEVVLDDHGQKLVIILRHAVLAEGIEVKEADAQLAMGEDPVSTVRIEIPKPASANYRKELSSDRSELRITFAEAPPLQGRLIVLDPGHGGVDAGAIGSQGAREKEINLAVALKLRKKLEEAGAHVLMTREDDKYVALYERAAIANNAGSIITLSIHCNFHPDPKVNGFEVFHHPEREDSALLARAIFEHAMGRVEIKPLAVKTSKDLVLTRETQMATVLIEMGFLSNRQEESLMQTAKFHDKMVEGIFEGISAFLQCNPEQGK